jgi:putative hydrolase of the HAD superfamily
MSIAAIMVDVDGVIVIHPSGGGWADHLERDLGISPKKLHEHFFEKHWSDIVCGRAGLRERLAPVLLDIAPSLTCEQLIAYWFANDAHLNLDLLRDLADLRQRGIKIDLATVQEHERAHYLWNNLGLRHHFDSLHYSGNLGCAKPDLAFYKKIENRTALKPSQIFFIDDRPENVDGAQRAGWTAALWTPQTKLHELLAEMSLITASDI